MMTLAALAAVGVLAAQAEATAPKVRAGSSATAKAGGSKSGTGSTSSNSTALPANSGSGTRIVYSQSAKRVWLVEGGSTVERTMQVVPGTYSAPAGTYTVTGKSPGSVGGDGKTVLYVVKFDSAAATSVGFDAESGVTGLPPAPTGRTGGIRMTQLDAQALYTFASVGTTVVVL
jgi:lipoprotein-anchoring transpeptidase ErfK/SrfK